MSAASVSRELPDDRWIERARQGMVYTADLNPPGCLHAAFVRSPHAHARIERIDRSTVEADEGVVAVITADDLDDTLGSIPCIVPLRNRDGTLRADPPRGLLARRTVRHQGEAVAMVVAGTEAQARRAAARLSVRYRPLHAVTDGLAALESGAPLVWEEAPGNLCFDWELGDASATQQTFDAAHHVVEAVVHNGRIVVAPMETRSAIGCQDSATGRLLLVTATQGVHWVRDVIARDVLRIAPEQLEVITPRVGGSFGSKIFVYPEQVLVLIGARRLGRPVRWRGLRQEAFLSDTQGRDQVTRAALALDEQGRFLAMRADTVANLGAHLSNYAPFNATLCGAPMLCGAYRIAQVYARVRGAFSHTPPVDSYRGAGRPEANHVLERLIDVAASRLGFDRVDLRRRNLVEHGDLPYRTATGLRLDSGRFVQNMERALDAADYRAFAARREASGRRGMLRGIGIANYLEANGGMALGRIMEPEGFPRESARLSFCGDDTIRVDIGTQSSGQGHAQCYGQLLADQLGWCARDIVVHQGRSGRLAQGTGTGGSKSLLTGSTALLQAASEVISKARRWAAGHWGVDADQVYWSNGRLYCGGRELPLREAVRRAAPGEHAAGSHSFDTEACATIRAGTYANGCHVCELEIDPATAEVHILRYVCVNDFGTILSEAHVVAQVRGGIAQGIGQALFEQCRFAADGTLLDSDFARYHLPQASELPSFEVYLDGEACTTNPLGIKGCAESGASGAPPAVLNAIQHALAEASGARCTEVQMPATPPRLWALIHDSDGLR